MEACCNSYAVVAYLRNEVGSWINAVRRTFAPDCPHLAHITVLPPRPLVLPASAAATELRTALDDIEPIEVGFGCVNKFETTQVVKLSIETGVERFLSLHDRLNGGALQFPDQYEYVPHVTISHELDAEQVDAALSEACRQWDSYGSDRKVVIDTLTLVQQAADGHWVDLEDFRLTVGVPAFVRARR